MTKNIPIYKKVFIDLKKLIEEGKYPVGSMLPSENELCKKYDTTRATVRHSIKELLILGYITRQQGKGSVVVEPKKGLGILSIRGVTAAVGNNALRTKILKAPVCMKWPLDFFYELSDFELEKGCIFFTRLRFVKDLPILYEETFLTNSSLNGFIRINLENNSLFKVLKERYDIEVKEGEQKIWAVKADIRNSRLLRLKPRVPLLYMQRKLKTNSSVNIYSSLYCNTNEYYLQDYF